MATCNFKGDEIKFMGAKTSGRYKFLRKIIKEKPVHINYVMSFGQNKMRRNCISYILYTLSPCNHTVKMANKTRGRKSVICPWCEAGEEQQK